MNDPGLDGPVGSMGQEVDNVKDRPDDDSDLDEEEEERSYLLPTRYWIASTAIPLIAGTFGPMANAFNICAIIQNWRVSVPAGGTEEHGIAIADPQWALAINGLSLASALIANMALLFNMARRIPFSVAQPITILGFYAASFLLIAIISIFGGGYLEAPRVKVQALTQAYYYATYAAGLYFIIASLMIFNVWGAYRGHYGREFKLTVSQRTLMLQTISYLTWLLLGALVFSKLEKWQYLDAVYFANFTLLTVGIGDYSPSTHAGRSFLFPYAVGGIVILGLVVGSVRSLVLDRGKEKMDARNFEKTRKAVLKRLTKEDRNPLKRGQALATNLRRRHPTFTLDPKYDSNDELQRRKAEFHIMRDIQRMSAVQRKWMSLVISGSCWFILWFIGALIFYRCEYTQQWTYFGALYFAYTSLLTIGYGDFSPMSNSGKSFFVFWSLLAIPTLTILISNMGDTVVQGIKDATLVLGELTVLPGQKGTYRDRIRVGISKFTGGRYDVGTGGQALGKRIDDREQKMQVEDRGVEERPPGLNYEQGRPGEGHNQEKHHHFHRHHRGADNSMVERLAGDMELSERKQEDEAHQRGDDVGEDEHHHRYLLIREIRKVYTQVGSNPPKKYDYEEWRHFLRLLGEDETDPSLHRKAPIQAPKTADNEKPEIEGALASTGDPESDSTPRSWSWIGNRSPLMGNKDEAEWVLERLVGKLEGELRMVSRASRQEKNRKETGDRVESRGSDTNHEGSSGTVGPN
ncbi:putative potassium channel [Phaeomoniella chlamydospora]|uniref:Putative potassium channel n=1 Tax=Phaeomoniella chlamydospora TaxID=158046 RepID=A0A0G2GXH0_PHACM|nr:putative potassium channel [Phaeomoniella chlamydospora]